MRMGVLVGIGGNCDAVKSRVKAIAPRPTGGLLLAIRDKGGSERAVDDGGIVLKFVRVAFVTLNTLQAPKTSLQFPPHSHIIF